MTTGQTSLAKTVSDQSHADYDDDDDPYADEEELKYFFLIHNSIIIYLSPYFRFVSSLLLLFHQITLYRSF